MKDAIGGFTPPKMDGNFGAPSTFPSVCEDGIEDIHMPKMPLMERMFELARDGPCLNVRELIKQLTREGYEGVDAHRRFGKLSGQMRQLMRDRN